LTFLFRPFRPYRPHEWSKGKAVTFIVTRAATRSVTLAARAAGMSRKSAYALKARDRAFAEAWKIAAAAGQQSHKVGEVATSPNSRAQGNRVAPAVPADRKAQEALRDRFFARLVALQADSAPVARRAPLA